MHHPGQLNRRATNYLREYSNAQGFLATSSVPFVVMQNWKPPTG